MGSPGTRPRRPRARADARAAQQRERLAREAARLMVEGGIGDYRLAKRKAAERLGVRETVAWPNNRDIERARGEYQRLFRADTQPRRLSALRDTALRAMRMLDRFEPRLVGPVLEGSADEHSPVHLHLFAEPPERVGLFLSERGVSHRATERRLRVDGDEVARLPAYAFLAGDVAVEIVVFSERWRRRAPVSPVDGRPMRRAALAAVEALAAGT